MNINSAKASLYLMKVEKYSYNTDTVFDTSGWPRPHFCMALVLKGSAEFLDCEDGRTVNASAGDVIFVPLGSRYVAKWHSEPNVEYVTVHFIFEYPGVFSADMKYMISSVADFDREHIKREFLELAAFSERENCELAALSRFTSILGTILPLVSKRSETEGDPRLRKALSYIEENYSSEITVSTLAKAANMSESRFYPAFHSAYGATPMEYVNLLRVNKAIILLLDAPEISIERVSAQVGYTSVEYFRRVFRKITGKTPREYRKKHSEI